jgi:2-polyprenyl-3-methyl-5-hydroxy-6-metoxy-1,4-benzoquinol methylase
LLVDSLVPNQAIGGDKRSDRLPPQKVQEGNRSWWTQNPMAYDWHGDVAAPRFSAEWFRAIDASFLHGARLFATRDVPFDRIIPFDALRGKRVLEIGCGMGLHSELLARARARLTSIDLSPTSIEATTRRLALHGLEADVRLGDAERLPFEDGSFDFVWSWGVIHHSSRTARIVREIARVLGPDGQCKIMVYNREGMPAFVALVKDYLLRGGFLRGSYEETLYRTTDGYSARYYVSEQFEDLFRAFFDDVHSEILGQESDAVPLPRRLRKLALKFIPESYLEAAQAKRGGFVFLTASRPR